MRGRRPSSLSGRTNRFDVFEVGQIEMKGIFFLNGFFTKEVLWGEALLKAVVRAVTHRGL